MDVQELSMRCRISQLQSELEITHDPAKKKVISETINVLKRGLLLRKYQRERRMRP